MTDLLRKSKFRFFNGTLKQHIYDSCVMPTEAVFNAGHAFHSNGFQKSVSFKSCWTNSTYRPPCNVSYPEGTSYFFSSPFKGFDPSCPRKQSSNKRQRTTSTRVNENDEDELRHKKTNGQLRKETLQGHFRVFKIRMLPTVAQRQELKRCFYVTRQAYNWANECVREGFEQPNHFRLRKKWNDMKMMDSFDVPGSQRVAGRIVSHAIQQLADAYRSNYAKRKKNPDHRFTVQFRSLHRTLTEALIIDKDSLKSDGSYLKNSPFACFKPVPFTRVRQGRSECLVFFGNNLKAFGGIRLQDKENVISKLVKDGNYLKEEAKIIWDKRTDSFHFAYLYALPKLEDPDPDFNAKRIVATDPGNAPFQQWYSPTSGSFGQLLEDARPVLKAKCLKLDALKMLIELRYRQPQACLTSRREDNHSPKRQRKQRYRTTRRLRRKLARDLRRVHGYVESAHYDAANFLLAEHEIIIQPVLSVSRLCKKNSRIFGNSTARAMYTWSHYLFRQRLKSASARYPGRHVYETSEPGTSKTCTNCGFWNASLRLGDKFFHCPRCGVQVDRQIAGARNNFFAAYGMAAGIGWDGVGG